MPDPPRSPALAIARPGVLAAEKPATRVGAPRMFTDKLSGAVNTHRTGLAALLHYARERDTVVVTAIDSGRSIAEVTRTIAELGQRRILLRALREGMDTGTPTGRAVVAIMATAEQHR